MTKTTRLSQMVLEGRYQPGTSFLHRLSPSLKMVGALGFVLLSTWGHLYVLAGLMIVCLLMMTLAHVPLKILGRLVYAFRWLFLLILIIPMVTVPGAPVELFNFLPFSISWEGVWAGSESILKLAVMFFLSLLLVRTTPPHDLMNTLQKAVIIPHPAWKKKIQEFFMTGLWAVQLIPMICVETEAFMLSSFEKEKEKDISGIKKAWRTALQLGPLLVHLLNSMDEWQRDLTGDPDWDRSVRSDYGRGEL